jgi:hypothetical protein
MIPKSKKTFVEDAVGLLVEHFGVDRVRIALAKVSEGAVKAPKAQPSPRFSKQQTNPSVTSMLEQIRQDDEEKYRLLTDFYVRLKSKIVLSDSQDIRYFSHNIGLKEIGGKSRKDMIPKLMRFLLEQPVEQLRVYIESAANVSEQQRQQGFSILTDKLLAETAKDPQPAMP